jgi:lipoprotein-anchoring transpeptidase ErfK/SrfK
MILNEELFFWPRWPVFAIIFAFWIFLMAEGISGTAGMHRVDEVKRAFRGFRGRYVLYVSKGEFRLYVYNRRGRIVTQYPVGYGLNPDRRPKLYEGDSRTPEGYYRVVQVLSRDANKKTTAYKKLKELNDRYLRAEDGHYKFGQPDVDTGRNAYGPRLFWIDYPNEKDREKYEEAVKRGLVPVVDGKVTGIGYGITIHGNNDPPSVGELSTAGCIIMYNRDIRALHKYVQVGTPVIISAD